jgi:hypothetical protein
MMKAFRITDENNRTIGNRKCSICAQPCQAGQTVIYVTRRGVVFHRNCLNGYVSGTYKMLPSQEDEVPGHPLFAEPRDAATERAFERYRRNLMEKRP